MPELPPKPSLIKRLNWRTKLVAVLMLLLGLLLLGLIVFTGGVVAGLALSQSGAKDRCTQAQGTWNEEGTYCEKMTEVEKKSKKQAYTCDTSLVLIENIDAERYLLTQSGSASVHSLTLGEVTDAGSVYSDSEVSLRVTSAGEIAIEEGEDTVSCARVE
jgi:hypothetical protein